MWSNHVLNDVNLKIWKQSYLSLHGLLPQLYSVSELIRFQQNNSNGREVVCDDNFKIEGENGCNWREREYAQLCVKAG